LTYSPLVASSSSSTPIVTSTSDSTLLDSPFPLGRCTGLEMGETSRGDVSVLEDASLLKSKEFTLVDPHLEEAPFVEFCGDLVMGIDTPSIEHIDPICHEPLDLTPTSSSLRPITPFPVHAFPESLGDIRGYNSSLDPYCAYLEDAPRKITWSTFFDNTFDFSMAFNNFMRPLTFFASSFAVLSYKHHSKMHAVTYDKLLRALTTSASRTRLLSD